MAVGLLPGPAPAAGAPVLRAAGVEVRFASPADCEVTLRLDVAGAERVEHRLELLEGAAVELVDVSGATAEPSTDIGRTRALFVTPAAGGGSYRLRYRVVQPASHPYRCPLWLPAVPTDGRSREVRISAVVPEGMSVSGGMPPFEWTGDRGQVALAHLPAFVTVPFGPPTEARAWDVARVMDAAALGTLAAASLLWAVRRKGKR